LICNLFMFVTGYPSNPSIY